MKEYSEEEQTKDVKDQKLIGEGVKFEHYQRACCRVVGNPETFPTGLRRSSCSRAAHGVLIFRLTAEGHPPTVAFFIALWPSPADA